MSDRIAVMSGGKVLQIGSPTEIYERPSCRFVADFIGESNFVQGRVSAIEPNSATITTADGLVLRGQASQTLQRDQEAFVSVRPEKARLSVQRPTGDAANVFPVTVDRVSYIGSDMRILVQLGQDQLFSVWEQNTRSTVDRDAYWQRGEQGYLWWPLENALVLAE
jgi:spermidine/putrescine transport system ATP-binding protein